MILKGASAITSPVRSNDPTNDRIFKKVFDEVSLLSNKLTSEINDLKSEIESMKSDIEKNKSNIANNHP